jgi:hypothetical protein
VVADLEIRRKMEVGNCTWDSKKHLRLDCALGTVEVDVRNAVLISESADEFSAMPSKH